MKHFKKWGFWVLYVVIVISGSLVIRDFCLEKNPLGIPNVNAQNKTISFPGDTFLLQSGNFNSIGTTTNFAAHPSGTFYIPSSSSSNGNPHNDYYMPGILTMPTASTCSWDCGPTYTTCASTCGRGSQTLMTCSSGILCGGYPSPTSSTCGIFCDSGPIPMPTSITCSSSIFCSAIPMPTSSTCSSGIFCGGGPMPTSMTCSGGIFCGRSPMPTSSTCSSGIFCGGGINTSLTCIGNCPTENPPIFPEGVTPGWGQPGPRIPGGSVNFPTFNVPTYASGSFSF